MKIIALVPAKNESWIIKKTLSVLSLFCDYVIVGDARSSDKTVDICKGFSKVVVVTNPNDTMEGPNRRQILLNKAREFGSDNIIFCFDADEIPTANILDNKEFWGVLKKIPAGHSLRLEFLNLWKSPYYFRKDKSIWSGQYRFFAFRDDGKTNYAPGDLHESKVPAGFEKNFIRDEKVKVMHFAYVLWDRMLSRQAHCRTKELNLFNRSHLFINFRYGITREERGIKLEKILPEWVEPYRVLKIAFDDLFGLGLYWFDLEILSFFKHYGAKKYKWIDIWDIDWNTKLNLARKQGYTDLPPVFISDPRNWLVKAYHLGLRLLNLGLITQIYSAFKHRYSNK